MNALRRRFLKLATLLSAVALLWACNAPFIPVPPPGASFTSELADDGMGAQKTVWITHGLPSNNAAGAYFYIFNERQPGSTRPTGGIIAVAGADGTYTGMPMDGDMGDHIRIAYETPAGAQSDSICLLLTTAVDPLSGSAPACPP